MTILYWCLEDKSQPGIVPMQAFLSEEETQKYEQMQFAKRRDEWLLGRYTAKKLLRAVLQPEPSSILEIRSASNGAPQVWVDGILRSEFSLSISHSGSMAFCSLVNDPDTHVGADLEKIEPRTPGFVQDYFTAQELAMFQSISVEFQALAATLIWSAKESMLKALQVGLKMDTRQVEVESVDGLEVEKRWKSLVVSAQGKAWQAWWQQTNGYVQTLVACTSVHTEANRIILQKII